MDPRHHLGITAAIEHFTAIPADWMLSTPTRVGWKRRTPADPVALAQARIESRARTERRLDPLYKGAGGQGSMAAQVVSTGDIHLPVWPLRQTIHNLQRDGTL